MKDKLVFGFMVLLVYGFFLSSCFAQSSKNLQNFKNKFNEAKVDAFMTGYSNTFDIWASYASSSNTLQNFKNRFNEIKEDAFMTGYSNTFNIWATYAS